MTGLLVVIAILLIIILIVIMMRNKEQPLTSVVYSGHPYVRPYRFRRPWIRRRRRRRHT